MSALTQEFSPRESGTDEEYTAGEELRCLLKEMGYGTRVQNFELLPTIISSVIVTAHAHKDLERIRSLPLSGSAMGIASGELVSVRHALPDQVDGRRLDGKVALIERGFISYQEKVERVEAAGAVAAVIFNRVDGLSHGKMVTEDVPAIPAMTISRKDGIALLEAAESGVVDVKVSVRSSRKPSRNIIAEKPGTVSRQDAVILGAHYDTAQFTPGANDNGSGLTALMAIANRIKDKDYPFTVQLILFGSAQVGEVGSAHYIEQLTEQDNDDILAMINLDALGREGSSGWDDSLEMWGSEKLMRVGADIVDSEDIQLFTVTGYPYEGDHLLFHKRGVPAVIITSGGGGNSWPRDTLEFVAPQLIVLAADIGIGLLDHLAEEEIRS